MKTIQKFILPLLVLIVIAIVYVVYFSPDEGLGSFADFDTNNMLYGIATYISEMTRYLTLYPGDIVWMGTDGATENMKPGDVCDVEIRGIGVLSNPIIAEE